MLINTPTASLSDQPFLLPIPFFHEPAGNLIQPAGGSEAHKRKRIVGWWLMRLLLLLLLLPLP